MNQQNDRSDSLTPSNVPKKQKCGRLRKEESGVQGENMLVAPSSDTALNSSQTAGTNCGHEMLGITGVIEGTFNAGYLINVNVADTDTCLRGAILLPDQVAPVTAENNVAPRARMIQRTKIPIGVLNPETRKQSSVPSSGQCNKQPFEPELRLPMSVNQGLPTELHSGISVSLENLSAPIVVPMAELPKIDSSISIGGMPQAISEPRHRSQSASIMSEFKSEKTVTR